MLLSDHLSAFSSRALGLIILPTEQCNLRCQYCYERFSVGRMPHSLVDGIKRLLSQRIPDLHYLELDWFGGEPLLAYDTIRDVSTHVASLLAPRTDIEYRSHITTNGFLLDTEKVQELYLCGVRSYQITLDGDAELHDSLRSTKAGGKTFDRIWDNLLAISRSSLKLVVSVVVHYSPATYDRLGPLMQAISRDLGKDPRFWILVKAIERLGGANDLHVAVFGSREQERMVGTSLLAQLRTVNPPRLSAEAHICYAAKPNYFVIRANGELCRCSVCLYDKRNTIGHLNVDGTLSISQAKMRPWLSGWELDSLEVLSCPWMHVGRGRNRAAT